MKKIFAILFVVELLAGCSSNPPIFKGELGPEDCKVGAELARKIAVRRDEGVMINRAEANRMDEAIYDIYKDKSPGEIKEIMFNRCMKME